VRLHRGDRVTHQGRTGTVEFATPTVAHILFDTNEFVFFDLRGDHGLEKLDTAAGYGRLDDDDPRPPYRQIAAQLRAAILSGVLQPGARLPSQTELAASFGVARMTVAQALRMLKDDTLIVARQGSGTYVRDQRRQTVSAAQQNVHTALAAFNDLRAERNSHQPEGDWDTTVFAFDQGLAELGEKLAAAVTDLLDALDGNHHSPPPVTESVCSPTDSPRTSTPPMPCTPALWCRWCGPATPTWQPATTSPPPR
jgi:DNA-binding transcriptional regulator YhcF (GntR family)